MARWLEGISNRGGESLQLEQRTLKNHITMACNPQKIIAALFRETDNVRDIVYERINTSDKTVLRKIPDGGVVERSSNQDTVIYGEAQQASMAYRDMDNGVQPLESGEMKGRKLSGYNGIFDTNINTIDESACHGFCTIDFAQGFRIRTSHDYGIDLDTPVKCARELDTQGKPHILGYFEGFRRQFTNFGMNNFSDNLMNKVIEFGEANASVLAANQFSVSAGGWQAPPEFRISIHFLEDYRDHIMAEMAGLAMEVPENWKLEVEMPKDDWWEAVMKHQIERYSMLSGAGAGHAPMTNYDAKILTDPKHALNGREFHDFGEIRCFFNSEPVRGYYKPTGTGTHSFVRVLPRINVVDEEAGLVLKANHQYRQDTITVEGIDYNMCTLIPHIHEKSFKRFGLGKPLKPMGEANMGVNFDVKVVDGAHISNNIQEDKFKLAARHEFRFKVMYPELSGFIAYRHSQDPGYVVDVTPRNYVDGDSELSSPEQFRQCDLIDPVTQENCAECSEVPTFEGDCVVEGTIADGSVGLDPAVTAFVTFNGAPHTARFAVRRTPGVGIGKAVSVDYVVQETTVQSAVDGTHFDAVAATTLNWPAGDDTPRFVDIPILDGSGDVDDDLDFEIILETPVGQTIVAGGDLTTITIEDVE